MTTFQKSLALWIGGAAIGYFGSRRFCHPKPWLGALLGASLVGSIGDVFLENPCPPTSK